MNAQVEIQFGIPAEQLTPEVRAALARLADENALLRAALAETRAQVGDLEESADSDPVTGLANERELERALGRSVSQANRHGRVAGDAALAHVARLLKGLIRTSDVAARTGAGFAVLLDHLDPDSAIDTGERIVRFVADQPLDLGSCEVGLQATVGVATILPGDDAEDVLRRAQRNLERVKEF